VQVAVHALQLQPRVTARQRVERCGDLRRMHCQRGDGDGGRIK